MRAGVDAPLLVSVVEYTNGWDAHTPSAHGQMMGVGQHNGAFWVRRMHGKAGLASRGGVPNVLDLLHVSEGCETVDSWSRSHRGRVAAHRRRRGISQAALAGLVGRSESWLLQVERGIRSVDSLTVILDLSRVLRVGPDKLFSRPWRYAPNGDPAEWGWSPSGASSAGDLSGLSLAR